MARSRALYLTTTLCWKNFKFRISSRTCSITRVVDSYSFVVLGFITYLVALCFWAQGQNFGGELCAKHTETTLPHVATRARAGAHVCNTARRFKFFDSLPCMSYPADLNKSCWYLTPRIQNTQHEHECYEVRGSSHSTVL